MYPTDVIQSTVMYKLVFISKTKHGELVADESTFDGDDNTTKTRALLYRDTYLLVARFRIVIFAHGYSVPGPVRSCLSEECICS